MSKHILAGVAAALALAVAPASASALIVHQVNGID